MKIFEENTRHLSIGAMRFFFKITQGLVQAGKKYWILDGLFYLIYHIHQTLHQVISIFSFSTK